MPVTTRPWRRLLRPGLVVSAALLVLAVALGGLVRGGAGALGAGAGVLLVAGSYVASTMVMAWAEGQDRRLLLPVGLIAYAVKFAVLGAVALAVAATGWSGLRPMALGMMAAVLAWMATQAWWTWTAKILYVDVDPTEGR